MESGIRIKTLHIRYTAYPAYPKQLVWHCFWALFKFVFFFRCVAASWGATQGDVQRQLQGAGVRLQVQPVPQLKLQSGEVRGGSVARFDRS